MEGGGDDREAAQERAFAEGYSAAERGEEAGPGCTVTAEGRAWLRGYVAGAGARRRSANSSGTSASASAPPASDSTA